MKTPPACSDGCFPNCFTCPAYIEEEDFAVCDDSEGKTDPCGLFSEGKNQSCHGEFITDDRECSARTLCPIGCHSQCYNCPPVDQQMTAPPKCRQLPVDKATTGCVKERTRPAEGEDTGRYCSDGSDLPCVDLSGYTTAEEVNAAFVGGF